MATAVADVRHAPVGLIHLSLAVGGFAIGTTEFATMSLLPYMSRGLHIDEPTAWPCQSRSMDRSRDDARQLILSQPMRCNAMRTEGRHRSIE